MIELSRQIGGGEAALVKDREAAACADEDFAALVRRQSRLVFRVAYSVLRNTHDSEDVAQETFLKLYRCGTWKKIEDERAFLARTAWRMAIDRHSRDRSSGDRRSKVRSETDEADLASECETPEQIALMSDSIAAVHKLVDALPRKLREPLVLATIEELTSHQIAEILGLPDGTVRTRLLRARQILKAKLAARIGGTHGK